MRRAIPVVLACVIALSGVTRADHHESAAFKADLLGQFEYAQKQIMSLEEAVPQEKYTWRPGEGVRSVSEVYLHVAFANYLLPKIAGFDVPAEAGWSMDPDAWEKKTTDKKEIAGMLTASFTYLKETVKKLGDADLEKKVDFFGTMMTVRSLMLTALSHHHEHLGQSIAYARMNNVVPPWTAEQQKKEKEKMDKGKAEKKY